MIGPRVIVGLGALLLAIAIALGLGAASVDRLAEIGERLAQLPCHTPPADEDLHALAREIWRLAVIDRVLRIAGFLTLAAAAWLTGRAVIRRVLGMTEVVPFR